MPIIVDREKEREKILIAFEQCLAEKPFDKITIRDIAEKCNISAPTVLLYFKTKREIVLAFVDYTINNTFRLGIDWVKTHQLSDFPSRREYVLSLFNSNGKFSSQQKVAYTGALNVYLMGQYDDEIREIVQKEMEYWADALLHVLSNELGMKSPDPNLARLIFSCSVGFCVSTYNGWFDKFTFESMRNYLTDIILEKLEP